jgi:hypothetical protein
VAFGAFSLYCPALLTAAAIAHARAFAALEPPGSLRALSAWGLRRAGGVAVPVTALEALGEAVRAAPRQNGAFALTPDIAAALGDAAPEAERILRGLGFVRAGKPAEGQPSLWRRKIDPRSAPAEADSRRDPRPPSPFAVLSGLAVRPQSAHAGRKRRSPNKRLAGDVAETGLFGLSPDSAAPESGPAPRPRRRRRSRRPAGAPAAP